MQVRGLTPRRDRGARYGGVQANKVGANNVLSPSRDSTHPF